MAESTIFGGVISFLQSFGFYDVVLPFLLVFTIMFAILEKTKILGTEDIKGVKYTKKNLNSIVAFVVAFLVVASTKLVAAINQIMANVVLLLILSISFLLLIGSFFKEDEDVYLKEGPWRTMFMIIMFVGIIVIFLHSFGWFTIAWDWLVGHWQTNFVATIVLLLFIALFMYYVIGGGKPSEQPKKSKEGGS
jgi:small-conductance mechanosensitive channel